MNIRQLSEREVNAMREPQYQNNREQVPVNEEGYPLFNGCTHTLIDLSSVTDETKTNNMHTLSVKLPNGDFVSLSVISYGGYAPQGDGCIDIHFQTSTRTTTVIGFNPGKADIRVSGNLYSLVFDTNKTG